MLIVLLTQQNIYIYTLYSVFLAGSVA